MSLQHRGPIEIWAGLECTLNRIGDVQYDQLELTGHYGREDDLDRLAELGVRTVRYPILWERLAGQPGDGPRWLAIDASMRRMQQLGIDPIVGLVHHGSGPLDTSLLDDRFPEGLADFAAAVSQRYPWVTRYTPVNEPLTTARFSALYGHWYPHERGDAPFLRALLNEIRGTRLAMHAIRRVVPAATLLQTDDLGQTHATPLLQYQADFENERRWLSFDLLCGRVVRGHAMYDYARWAGISDDDIARAVGDGCEPSTLGINHYVTSERWIDEALERYPVHAHGGNDRHRYADVEAVRAPASLTGLETLLLTAWHRYGIPLAVTESHLGCTREQQLRWLADAWSAASRARDAGADVQAVTAWAAYGCYGWTSLMTDFDGRYESGVFDIRAPQPRPTALAGMVRGFAQGGSFEHPVLATPGWWRCVERVTYGSASTPPTSPSGPPILITGAEGTLGTAFARLCAERGLAYRAASRHECDITQRDALSRLLDESGAWAVVNAAGYVRVDDAEHNPTSCHAGNVAGAVRLAHACAKRGIPLLTFSSDLVFDGSVRRPYVETDLVAPVGVYASSKAEAEKRVRAILPTSLVVRSAAFFGPWDEWNFLARTLRLLADGIVVDAASDLVVSPTYVPDLVHASLDLLIDGECGIWHLANVGAVTWEQFARLAAEAAGLDADLVRGRSAKELGYAARRPRYSVLGSERGTLLQSLSGAMKRFNEDRVHDVCEPPLLVEGRQHAS